MGMSDGRRPQGGRRRRGVPRYGAMADINMTPFIDVMLVLHHHLHGGGAIAGHRRRGRPAADEIRAAQHRAEAGSISIDEGARLMDQPVAIENLVDKLKEAAKSGADETRLCARLQGGELRARGGSHVALVTKPNKKGSLSSQTGAEVRLHCGSPAKSQA